jgi:hypothetical protein
VRPARTLGPIMWVYLGFLAYRDGTYDSGSTRKLITGATIVS